MKICTKCQEQKDDEEFAWKSKAKGIRQTQCKICTRKASKCWYEKNANQHVLNTRTRTKERVGEIKAYLNSLNLKCIKCGENHPAVLDFHHRDPASKEGAVSNLIYWRSVEGLQKEIEKCDILCSNCHRKHHWNERNVAR